MAGMSSCKNGDAASLKYEKYKLDNGLEVVLHEDKSDPVVSVAIQYHVGSNREKPGKTGFAHFFEHMLFQRSENLPRNAFFQKIDAMGGSFNGGTSNDGTVYFETVPRDALEKVLWMESDRMGYFINTVTEGGLKREIDVVSNEKRQGENVPYGLAFDLVFKNLFPEGHPYSWTVIGEIPDLRSATVEDVKEFYNKYYTTSNATLVVAGDFDVAKTKELIQKYFGEIPARPKPEAPVVQNVTLDSTKRISYEDAFCNAPMIVMTYPAVEAYNEDGYALDFLCNLLAGDKKSPMYKVLVEERKLVPSVDMFNYQLEIAGLALLNATTFPGVNLNDVYAGIEEAYARFEKEGVDPKDLERYKNIEETRIYNRLVSTNGKAIAMAHDNVFGGSPDRTIHELEKYKAVTPEDVMRVYNKYIKGKPYLGISIVPKGQLDLALTGFVPAVVNQESIEDQQLNSQGGAIVDDPYERTPSSFDRSVEPALMSNTPELKVPAVWNATLGNGMTVKGIVYSELPLVNFAIELGNGMLADTPAKAGLAKLTANMLNEGPEYQDAGRTRGGYRHPRRPHFGAVRYGDDGRDGQLPEEELPPGDRPCRRDAVASPLGRTVVRGSEGTHARQYPPECGRSFADRTAVVPQAGIRFGEHSLLYARRNGTNRQRPDARRCESVCRGQYLAFGGQGELRGRPEPTRGSLFARFPGEELESQRGGNSARSSPQMSGPRPKSILSTIRAPASPTS